MAVLREFKPQDVHDVLNLYLAESSWFEDIGVSKQYLLECSQRTDFKFHVAEDAGKITGFVGCLYFTSTGRAEAGPIIVSQTRRGAGVGRQLMGKSLEFLKSQGIRRVTARVKTENKGAIMFFTKMGFTLESYFRNYTAKGEDALQYVTYLS